MALGGEGVEENTSNLKDLKKSHIFHFIVTTFNNVVPITLEWVVQRERYSGRESFICISYFPGIVSKQNHQGLALVFTLSLPQMAGWLDPGGGCPIFHNPTSKSASPQKDGVKPPLTRPVLVTSF